MNEIWQLFEGVDLMPLNWWIGEVCLIILRFLSSIHESIILLWKVKEIPLILDA